MSAASQNYSTSFLHAINKTLGWEGGYSNDLDDPGGETNWGIAKRYHPDVDIKNLTRDGAIALYWDEDWRPMRLDELRDPRIAGKILDTVVNQDRRIAPGALQGALILLGQNLTLDYKIGPATIAAVNSYKYPEALLEVFTVLRGMAYLLGAEHIEEVIAMIRQRKDRLKKNIRGWLKRLELGALVVLFALCIGVLDCLLSSAFARDPAQAAAFRKTHPCPATRNTAGPCPGFVVDHLIPLCWGGADSPSNMAWEPYTESLIKDQFEREACALKRKLEAKS